MSVSKRAIFNIADTIINLTALILAILYFTTDIAINIMYMQICLLCIFLLRAIKSIKSKKYLGYLYFIPVVLYMLLVIRTLF